MNSVMKGAQKNEGKFKVLLLPRAQGKGKLKNKKRKKATTRENE